MFMCIARKADIISFALNFIKTFKQRLRTVQLAECWPSMHRALGSTPSTVYTRRSGNVHCNPTSWEKEAGGSEGQGHPQLHSQFEDSLG